MTARLLLHALPTTGDVADAAELTRAANELGPLVALILGATRRTEPVKGGTATWK